MRQNQNRRATKSVPSSPESSRVLSFNDLESRGREELEKVSKAYVKLLDRHICYHAASAAKAIRFFERDLTAADQVRNMAHFIFDTACNEDGSPMCESVDTLLDMMTIDMLDAVSSAIISAQQDEREKKAKKSGNGSRR